MRSLDENSGTGPSSSVSFSLIKGLHFLNSELSVIAPKSIRFVGSTVEQS